MEIANVNRSEVRQVIAVHKQFCEAVIAGDSAIGPSFA
jgi:hypothetical protein